MINFVFDIEGWLPSAALALTMTLTWLIGWKLGQRLLTRGESSPESKWDDAALALLGLLLAFSFGVSISKYDQRRLMVVADSNAIGDFYTCASLLNDPWRIKLQTVIREYARLRFELTRMPLDEETLQRGLEKSEALQQRMTDLVAQAVAAGTPISVSLTNTLNALISAQAARLAAYRDRLPPVVVLLLFASGIVTALLVGREQGAANQAQVVGTLSFIVLVSLTVYVIIDLNQPGRGLIRASQESLERLLVSIS